MELELSEILARYVCMYKCDEIKVIMNNYDI